MLETLARVLKLFLCVCAVLSISACGATLSPVKRKPLKIQPFQADVPRNPMKLAVRFEDTIPGKPLPETVWDNATGAFWDERESRRIGRAAGHQTNRAQRAGHLTATLSDCTLIEPDGGLRSN